MSTTAPGRARNHRTTAPGSGPRSTRSPTETITSSSEPAASRGARGRPTQPGAAGAGAADPVLLHAGPYVGFRASRAGPAGAPITFSARGTVNTAGAAPADRDAIHIEGASYIVVEGVTVT